jgi:hypothetical protein
MSAASPPAMEGQPPVPDVRVSPAADWRGFANLKISPAIQRSLEAFRAALPELLKAKTERQVWVAFCGDQLVGFGRTKAHLFQVCRERGIARGTFVIRMVEPKTTDEWEFAHDS